MEERKVGMCMGALRTSGLHEERDYIARDEELREPPQLDHGMLFSLCQEDDASKDHVDGGGHEGGRDKNQDVLHDVWAQAPAARLVGSTGGASAKTKGLALEGGAQVSDLGIPAVMRGEMRKDLQTPPTIRAVRYQVLVLYICKTCKTVVMAKRMAKAMAPDFEGS